ncbi:UDP-N-acetylglucosamine--N-acetylmuramyl-(pentapeptide) pyrophosphoryl-undecaprenol N-acetylglucosamine transferase [Spirochaetia bacterium]|nr:UDP-N-acetylglucosamine--N-acetylmuramyl-(pentapeptide) pyrophosphoryl-undecaprenol N-acetylglucosamine transferase [Spirochaetia bacterium]
METIAFTGGGTGGHIYPGLAVVAHLPYYQVLWIGSNTGMDRGIIEKTGVAFFGIPAGKLRRYFSFENFRDVLKVISGFFAARKILKKEKPALLFSKGGYVSVPPVLAAASLCIPVFIHESDFSPGLATKIALRFTQKIFVAYPETATACGAKYQNKIIVSGNPVRMQFRNADATAGRKFLNIDPDEKIVLILGGSQGAHEVNNLIQESLPELTKIYTVVHQTGNAEQYAPSFRYYPLAYIGEEMPHLLAAAELVVGRSGAGTVWECATVGVPMMLIPLRGNATRGDQVENAGFFERAGAALVLEQPDSKTLVETIYGFAHDPEKRNRMAAAAQKIGTLDGACCISHAIKEFVEKS